MAETRAFRFGAAVAGAGSRVEWVALAQRVAELGYAVLLVPDHFDEEFLPSVALMAAADAAPHLRVGSYVYDNDFRHPALLAKEAATLDLLSEGRLEFGIGAGWNPADYQQTGLPFESAGDAHRAAGRGAHHHPPVFHAGVGHIRGELLPGDGTRRQAETGAAPHPPIFIGGGGKRVLTLAGQEADIVGLHFKVNADNTVDAEERLEGALARKIAWVREAAGERFAAIELNLLLSGVLVTDDRAAGGGGAGAPATGRRQYRHRRCAAGKPLLADRQRG